MHCELPRVSCSACGATTQLQVPWAREGSRFTLLFEAFSLTLAREMPVSACARILRCSDNALRRQIDAHVDLARAKESYADVTVIGIDVTSCAKGQAHATRRLPAALRDECRRCAGACVGQLRSLRHRCRRQMDGCRRNIQLHRFWPDELAHSDIAWQGVRRHRQVTDAYLAGELHKRGQACGNI